MKLLGKYLLLIKSEETRIFLRQLLLRYRDDKVPELSSQISYYLVLSVFPFLIFFLNLLSYTPLADQAVLERLLSFLPKESQIILYSLIKEILLSSNLGLMSFGAILTIWSASNGIFAIIKAVNRAYDLDESKNFIKLRLISVVFTFFLIILLIISLSLSILTAPFMENYFEDKNLVIILLSFLKLIIPLLSLFLGLLTLYSLSTLKNSSSIKISDNIWGALIASLGLGIFSKVFSIYINNFANYSRTYGSIGGIIILLIWLYMSGILVVMGAEINAVLLSIRGKIGLILEK